MNLEDRRLNAEQSALLRMEGRGIIRLDELTPLELRGLVRRLMLEPDTLADLVRRLVRGRDRGHLDAVIGELRGAGYDVRMLE